MTGDFFGKFLQGKMSLFWLSISRFEMMAKKDGDLLKVIPEDNFADL
jgi:hypothetical protein